jgi:hypothetical protein
MQVLKTVVALFSIAAVSFMGGCAKAPEQSVKNAKEALTLAINAEAGKYAGKELDEVQQLFDGAMAMIQKEEKRLFLTRDFSEADKNLDVVISRAKKAAEMALMEKERQRVAAEKAQQAAEKGKARKTVNNVPVKGKTTTAKKTVKTANIKK